MERKSRQRWKRDGMSSISGIGTEKLRQALEAVKLRLCEIAGEDARLIVYGSYARGEAREDSDVDLMVVLPDAMFEFEIKDRIHDAIFDIGFDADFLLAPLIVSESIARKFEGFKVFASVEREGIPV